MYCDNLYINNLIYLRTLFSKHFIIKYAVKCVVKIVDEYIMENHQSCKSTDSQI